MPLISVAWRTPLIWTCALAAAVFAALAATLGTGGSTSFDEWMFDELGAHVGAGAALTLLGFSTPALSVTLLALVVLFAVLLRRWDVAALAALGPGITVLLTREVLKPLLGRELIVELNGVEYSAIGSFPSGHESAVASASLVLAIIAGRLPLSRRARTVFLSVLAVWILVAGAGLVRNYYHYATDAVGAIVLAAAVVPATALAIDALAAARRRSHMRDEIMQR